MIKKVTLLLLGLFSLIIISSFIFAKWYKKEINTYIIQTANKKLNANFSFHDASIGFIKSFPLLAIDVEEVQLIGKGAFSKDTLAKVEELSVQIDLLKYFFDKKINIERIKVNKADLKLVVLKDGSANWDIIKTDTTAKSDTTETPLEVALQYYEIKQSNISYKDDLRGFSGNVQHITHSGSGDFTKDIFTLETNTEAEKLTMSYLGKTYLSEVRAALKAPLKMDLKRMEFTFKNNDLVLNELPIHFNAWFAMPDSTIAMDINFNANTSPLKDFLSLVPILYQNSFKELTASGNFTLGGYVKGKLSDTQMPGFGMHLKIENGAFKYQSIPAGIKRLYLDLSIDNTDGIVENSIIKIQNLQMALNNQLIRANLLVKNPTKNPYIKGEAKGEMDFGALLKIIPQKDLTLSGHLKTDITIDGTVNELKKAKGYAKGAFELRQLAYFDKKIDKKITIPIAQFNITPQKLIVSNFQAFIGNSDINATGSLENYLLYFLKNEPLAGSLTINSKQIDLNELMDLQTTTTDTSSTAFELPKNIHFSSNAHISKILFKNYTISNASGGITFADQQINFNTLKFNLLDADFDISGLFSKKEHQLPNTQIDFKIQHLEINKAYKNFNVVQKFAPIAESARGSMSVNMALACDLSNNMSPDLNSINSEGDLFVNDLDLNGSSTINKIVDLVKWEQFKTLNIKPIHLSYSIKNGRSIIKPFDITTNLNKINVKGSNGLDQTIDYTISSSLPIQAINNNQGLNGTFNKVIQQVKVQVLVTGKIQSPTLKLNTENIAQQAKEVVKEEIKKQVDTKLNEAQKEADAILLEAKALSEKIKQEAYAKADQLVAETKNPFAQIGVKLVADKLKKEADKKADKILEDARLKAQEVINNAKEKNQ